jgi:hypothetical protein
MEQLSLDSITGVFSAEKITKYWKNNQPTLNSSNFTDPYFQPDEYSLLAQDEYGQFLDKKDGESKAKEIDVYNIEWKRAPEIFGQNLLLFDEKIECSDIRQGNLGNCYFLSALAALTEFPKLIYQIFRTKEINPEGFYEIALFIDGEWQIVFVDDFFPVVKGTKNFAFARPNGNELWVVLLEKAWAKVNGGYANIISGWPSDTLAALTGFATQRLSHKELPIDELWTTLKMADESDKIMCTSTKQDKSVESNGLVQNHAYTLIGAKDKIHEGQELRLVKIRNPWGYREWKGDWSDNSHLWTEELKKYFEKVSSDEDDGTFYMSLDDFVLFFDCTHVCHVMYDSNIKSFKVNSDSIHVPHVFNLNINESARVAISVVSKHWRYNREIKNKNRPLTLVIAKYNQETSTFTQVEGDYSAIENVEFVKSLTKGLYAIWVYCNYNSCQDPKPEFYSVIFSSPTKYRVRQESTDNNFQLIKELIIGGLKEQNAEKIKSEDFVFLVDNTFSRTGIGYSAVFNQKDNFYQRWENDASGFKQMSLFPPYEGKEKFEFLVPPKGYAICLGMRTAQRGTYWFNLESSYKTISCQQGVDPTNTKKTNLEMFVSNEVCYDDTNQDNYYDYVSSSHDESKKEIKFKHVNAKLAVLEDLNRENPILMKMLLDLPGNDSENYYWNKINLDGDYDTSGDYYIGQFSTKTKQFHGRGAYYFSNDNKYYIGYWENGLRHKSGKFCQEDFSPIYEGEYSNGMKHGKGKYYFLCGDIYHGSFADDKRHGFGVYTYESGDRWEGPCVNGAMHGIGMYYPADGEEPWQLEFINNQPQ